MDKFGIFNLLNSFLDFYKSNSAQNSTQVDNKTPPLTPPKKEENNSAKSAPPSLSSQLLSISQMHDEHVKRVKKSAQTNR